MIEPEVPPPKSMMGLALILLILLIGAAMGSNI